MGSLIDIAEKIPVQLSDGEVDWTILSVQKVLEYMIAESPNSSRQSLRHVQVHMPTFCPMFVRR